MTMVDKLTIELVPASSFFNNLRAILTKSQWDVLRKKVYKLANYKCEICGGVGKKHPVECHEKWEYDDTTRVQKLVGLYALCPDCHSVKHIGFAALNNKLDKAIKHFTKINNLSDKEAATYIQNAFVIWEERSKHEWDLDLSWLKEFLKDED